MNYGFKQFKYQVMGTKGELWMSRLEFRKHES